MDNFLDFNLLAQSATEATASVGTATDPAGQPQPAAQGRGGSMFIWFMLPLLLLLMFSMGGGNRKRQKEMQAMLAALEKGDKVQTIGGIIGTVAHVKEGSVVLKVDENAKMEFATNAIQTVLEKKNPVPVAPKKGFFASMKDKIGGKKAKDEKSASKEPVKETVKEEAKEAAPAEEVKEPSTPESDK